MSARHLLSAEYVRQCLREENGRLFWLYRPAEHFVRPQDHATWNSKYSGKEAGHRGNCAGTVRWVVCINYERALRSHVVWLFHHGVWPEEIDHKDRNALNDQIDNLRPATQQQNTGNATKRKDNKSGYKGVFWCNRSDRWIARITVNYKQLHLGVFHDPAEAHAAYVRAAEKHRGEFACGG